MTDTIAPAEQRANRIAMWRAEMLNPDRDEVLTPLAALLADFERDVRAEAREQALDPLVNATEFQTSALSAVLAADVWDSHVGRSRDYADLSDLAQRVVRDRARRHLDALRRFLTR